MSDISSTIDQIRGRGYWRVDIHPKSFDQTKNLPKNELIEKMKENSVSVRGWDYPHIPTLDDDKQARYFAGNKAESWINWDIHKEVWQFFENRQFIHFCGIYNDWYENMESWGDTSRYKEVEPNTKLDLVEVIYRLTEIFLFIKNLFTSEVLDKDAFFEISLHNLSGRYLMTTDQRRFFDNKYYKCVSSEFSTGKRIITKNDIIEKSNSIALDIAEELFLEFQWVFPKDAFRDEQERLISRKLF